MKENNNSVKDMLDDKAYELMKMPKIEMKYGPIEFLSMDTIDKGQEGFRFAWKTGEKNDNWIGDEYVIIGYDYSAGFGPEPFMVNTIKKELPVYWLMPDGGDWDNPTFVSSSLEKFNKEIHMLKEYENDLVYNVIFDVTLEEIVNKIIEIEGNDELTDYWDSFFACFKVEEFD